MKSEQAAKREWEQRGLSRQETGSNMWNRVRGTESKQRQSELQNNRNNFIKPGVKRSKQHQGKWINMKS